MVCREKIGLLGCGPNEKPLRCCYAADEGKKFPFKVVGRHVVVLSVEGDEGLLPVQKEIHPSALAVFRGEPFNQIFR